MSRVQVRERWRAQRQADAIKRTVYVCDIAQQITEEQLTRIFGTCGQVCRRSPETCFAFWDYTRRSSTRSYSAASRSTQ